MRTEHPPIVGLGFIPHGLTAKDVFPPLMKAGWQLLVPFAFVEVISEKGGEMVGDSHFAGTPFYATHTLVPFAGDDEGLWVIVGWPHLPVEKIRWTTVPA